jgi:hypothetical protein
VADIVDKRFVPGPTERLKKIELRTFNKFVMQIRLDIIQNYIFLNREVGHGKEAAFWHISVVYLILLIEL